MDLLLAKNNPILTGTDWDQLLGRVRYKHNIYGILREYSSKCYKRRDGLVNKMFHQIKRSRVNLETFSLNQTADWWEESLEINSKCSIMINILG